MKKGCLKLLVAALLLGLFGLVYFGCNSDDSDSDSTDSDVDSDSDTDSDADSDTDSDTDSDSDSNSDTGTGSDTDTSQNLLVSPQKVVIDTARDRYLVSNFNGGGDLVQIDYDGNQSYFVEDAGFIDGMAIAGDVVYGTGAMTGGSVKGYNLDTAQLVMDINVDGVEFLSGYTADASGNLYATDRFGTKIIKIVLATQEYSTLVDDPSLDLPNGIIFEEESNRLVLISDRPNPPIQAVSLDDFSLSTLAELTLDGADGIDRDAEGNYYITGYYLPAVYKLAPDFTGEPEVIHKENYLVYPTYNAQNNSIMTTNYNQNTVVEIPLDAI